jgi:hypothetical protein
MGDEAAICPRCEVIEVLKMEDHSPSTVIEGVLVDGNMVKLKSGKELGPI